MNCVKFSIISSPVSPVDKEKPSLKCWGRKPSMPAPKPTGKEAFALLTMSGIKMGFRKPGELGPFRRSSGGAGGCFSFSWLKKDREERRQTASSMSNSLNLAWTAFFKLGWSTNVRSWTDDQPVMNSGSGRFEQLELLFQRRSGESAIHIRYI